VTTQVLTLAAAPLREPLTLVTCLIEPQLRSRLATLGLRCGAHLEVVQKTAGRGRIVAVAGSRIAMDASVLGQLTVRPGRPGGAQCCERGAVA
jgi:ferrous iron transport protein A